MSGEADTSLMSLSGWSTQRQRGALRQPGSTRLTGALPE